MIYAAATVPVNPSGVERVLTIEELWKGLELKVRKPELFLPVIDTCKVLEDKDGVVVREVVFKPGGPSPHPAVETITHYPPIHSDAKSGVETFQMKDSKSRVLNIVSEGPDGELLLTFTFEWEFKDIKEGSEEAIEKQKGYQKTAPKAVAGTVQKIRDLISSGEL